MPAFSEDSSEETNRPAKAIKSETEQSEQQNETTGEPPAQQQQQQQQPVQQQQQQLVQSANPSATNQYTPTVVQTISNPDGTVSIIQVLIALKLLRHRLHLKFIIFWLIFKNSFSTVFYLQWFYVDVFFSLFFITLIHIYLSCRCIVL